MAKSPLVTPPDKEKGISLFPSFMQRRLNYLLAEAEKERQHSCGAVGSVDMAGISGIRKSTFSSAMSVQISSCDLASG